MASPNTNMDAHIAGLHELTEMLRGGNEAVYGTPERGLWPARGLLWEPEVAVLTCRAEAGAAFDLHVHGCAEALIVYRGSIRVDIRGESRIYGVGETATLEPGEPHQVTALEACAIVAVTVPAEGSYPHVAGSGQLAFEEAV